VKIDKGTFLVRVRKAGRNKEIPNIYLPPILCTKYQINEGDKIMLKENIETGTIEIIPYIPIDAIET